MFVEQDYDMDIDPRRVFKNPLVYNIGEAGPNPCEFVPIPVLAAAASSSDAPKVSAFKSSSAFISKSAFRSNAFRSAK